jgi:hypothetical protein
MGQIMKIIFTNIYKLENILESPRPAKNFIPEWYKKMSAYVTGEKVPFDSGQSNGTIKKCMPVFDAITAGYIITSVADLYVEIKEDGSPFYKWSGYDLLGFHIPEQTIGHPAKKNDEDNSSPKFINPWSIKTPKGYSVLIIQPMHRESPFTILPGVVDTDTYTQPVNFPFTLNDKNWEGLIPAGTPIAQIIPFKRESWKMEIGGEKELKEIDFIKNKFSTVFWDKYKRWHHQNKEYK